LERSARGGKLRPSAQRNRESKDFLGFKKRGTGTCKPFNKINASCQKNEPNETLSGKGNTEKKGEIPFRNYLMEKLKGHELKFLYN